MEFISKIKTLLAGSPKPSAEVAEGIVERLVELGYFKFAPESERAVVREQLVESVKNRYLDSQWDEDGVSSDQRSYSADAEDLAEGNVGACIHQMRNALIHEGVHLVSVQDDFGEKRYQVIINGTAYLIYDDPCDPQQNLWALATERLLQIVNSLLEGAGSEERLFAIYGGNDGRVILLTPQMHELLRTKSDVIDQNWMPRSAAEIAASE